MSDAPKEGPISVWLRDAEEDEEGHDACQFWEHAPVEGSLCPPRTAHEAVTHFEMMSISKSFEEGDKLSSSSSSSKAPGGVVYLVSIRYQIWNHCRKVKVGFGDGLSFLCIEVQVMQLRLSTDNPLSWISNRVVDYHHSQNSINHHRSFNSQEPEAAQKKRGGKRIGSQLNY